MLLTAILTLAVAVDANVLIYERIREEQANGKSVMAAIDSGFSRAMSTIMDANATHVLAGLILLGAYGGRRARGGQQFDFRGIQGRKPLDAGPFLIRLADDFAHAVVFHVIFHDDFSPRGGCRGGGLGQGGVHREKEAEGQ